MTATVGIHEIGRCRSAVHSQISSFASGPPGGASKRMPSLAGIVMRLGNGTCWRGPTDLSKRRNGPSERYLIPGLTFVRCVGYSHGDQRSMVHGWGRVGGLDIVLKVDEVSSTSVRGKNQMKSSKRSAESGEPSSTGQIDPFFRFGGRQRGRCRRHHGEGQGMPSVARRARGGC